MITSRSECKGPWMHRFRILRQWPETVEEVCDICHKRMFFKIRGGRVDNYHYLSFHLRSALQRWHRRFNKEYATKL